MGSWKRSSEQSKCLNTKKSFELKESLSESSFPWWYTTLYPYTGAEVVSSPENFSDTLDSRVVARHTFFASTNGKIFFVPMQKLSLSHGKILLLLITQVELKNKDRRYHWWERIWRSKVSQSVQLRRSFSAQLCLWSWNTAEADQTYISPHGLRSPE